MNKKILDIAYGAVALLFSIFCFSYLIPVQVKASRFAVGYKTFPQLSALLIGFSGFMLVVTRFWELPDKKAVFRKGNYSLNWKHLLRQAILVAATVAYIILIPVWGFVIISSLYLFVMLYYLGSNAPVKNAIVSVAFPLTAYFLFTKLFHVRLPPGLLPF